MKKRESKKIEIEEFIQYILTLAGLQRGCEFTVTSGKLRIIKLPIRGRLLSVLKEEYPQYSYYWETPKILCWF